MAVSRKGTRGTREWSAREGATNLRRGKKRFLFPPRIRLYPLAYPAAGARIHSTRLGNSFQAHLVHSAVEILHQPPMQSHQLGKERGRKKKSKKSKGKRIIYKKEGDAQKDTKRCCSTHFSFRRCHYGALLGSNLQRPSSDSSIGFLSLNTLMLQRACPGTQLAEKGTRFRLALGGP